MSARTSSGVCRKYFMIRVVLKSGWTLCSVVMKVRNPLPMGKHSKVVY